MKLIPLDAVLAEVERLKADALQKKSQCKRSGLERIIHQIGAYNKILSFINSLEVKEVDLDYIKKELDELIRFNKPDGNFGWGTLYNVATHFFELGLKAQKGEEV